MKVGRFASATDPGRKRRLNEDAFVVRPPLFAIADGMGGARAGEIASALAASALNEAPAENGGGEELVKQLVQEGNRRVHERASSDPSTSGMGTTMTVALVEPNGDVTFGHVGDSRAYVLRDGQLEQLTDDHSLVAELVRRGELSARDAEMHPQRSVITRAIGTDPDVDVDAFTVRPQAGDLYLICSDGLSDMIPNSSIEEILRKHRDDLNAATKALVKAANRSGGDDNITAVLFEIVGDDAPAQTADPDQPTREHAAPSFDEEDTLHPEQGIAPPPAPSDTMVVPAAEIDAALAAEPGPAPPQAGIGRRLLALLVIIALIVVIVALVWWGLAR
ncbi:MAG TPA: Stp1/IreP family PP2C-type Ser/Thr phosphatase [Gaiellaceae bacterium]|nr:Stp1/IreP family PP2C-type Ser/Thr phosphatase [Gaiellaceae bacterium]